MRMRAVLAAALALLGTVAMTATPAGAAPKEAPRPGAGKGFVTLQGVLTFEDRTATGDMTTQVSPPESFCYVMVTWPAAILPDYRATATWSLDCRSRANPSLPAPDIALVNMQVRVHKGAYSIWDPTQSIGGRECQTIYNTKPSCSGTSQIPLEFGVPYHTQLDVRVQLTGGAEPVGAFYTDAIRLS